jgi:hypothetical protein
MSKTTNQITTLENNNLTQAEIQKRLAPYTTLEIPNPLDLSFEEPKKYGNYTRIEKGENRLRILSEGIFGVEYWEETEETDQQTGKPKQKPVRRPIEEEAQLPTSESSRFIALFVWNYKAERVQIFPTTKRGIIKGLRYLIDNKSWGDPTKYDICITKTQTDPNKILTVEYNVTPVSMTDLDPEIAKEWQSSGFNRNDLLLMFEGLDPFECQRQAKEEENKAINN